MLRYQTILLDADDTLLDFGKSERQALERTFSDHQLPFTQEIDDRYQAINKKLWKQFEQNQIGKEALLNARFTLLFQEMGLSSRPDLDGAAFNREYLDHLGEGSFLLDQAEELCRRLYKMGCRLYLATNGVSRAQYRRINGTPIAELFSALFVSEDTGYQKPMKEYFEAVLSKVPGFCPKRAIMVGDSLSSDIRGAVSAGLDSCWYNPRHLPNQSGVKPTYEISELLELEAIVSGTGSEKERY